MDDAYEVQHANPYYQRFVWVSWKTDFPDNDDRPEMEDPLPRLQSFCNDMIQHYTLKCSKEIYIEFGGTRLSEPWVMSMMEYLSTKDVSLAISTPAEFPLEFWEKVLKFDLMSVYTTYTPMDHENTDDICKLIDYVAPKTRLHVDFIIRNKNDLATMDRIAEMSHDISVGVKEFPPEMDAGFISDRANNANRLITRDPLIQHNRIRGDMVLKTDDHGDITMSPAELLSHGYGTWKDWSCHIGMESLAIDCQHTVRRSWCFVGPIIGFLQEGHWRFPTEPITCTKDYCICPIGASCTKTWY